jgi:hypothetical protein
MKMKWVKWSAEAVVSLRGAVAGSNLVGRTFRDFQAKKTYMMLVGAHQMPSKLGPPVKKNFAFFLLFSVQTLPSVRHSAKPLPSA